MGKRAQAAPPVANGASLPVAPPQQAPVRPAANPRIAEMNAAAQQLMARRQAEAQAAAQTRAPTQAPKQKGFAEMARTVHPAMVRGIQARQQGQSPQGKQQQALPPAANNRLGKMQQVQAPPAQPLPQQARGNPQQLAAAMQQFTRSRLG
jgi:hypothetical protein